MVNAVGLVKLILWQMGQECNQTRKAVMHVLQGMLNYLINAIYVQHKTYKLKQELKLAATYDQWEVIAAELDKINGKNRWKSDPRSNLYDYRNALYLTEFLSHLRERGLTKGIVHTLR